jgi:hypothetical protein
MKPPKHIVKLGKEAVMLWKLQQALGKQIGTDRKNYWEGALCAEVDPELFFPENTANLDG